jgi:hypothetical protein
MPKLQINMSVADDDVERKVHGMSQFSFVDSSQGEVSASPRLAMRNIPISSSCKKRRRTPATPNQRMKTQTDAATGSKAARQRQNAVTTTPVALNVPIDQKIAFKTSSRTKSNNAKPPKDLSRVVASMHPHDCARGDSSIVRNIAKAAPNRGSNTVYNVDSDIGDADCDDGCSEQSGPGRVTVAAKTSHQPGNVEESDIGTQDLEIPYAQNLGLQQDTRVIITSRLSGASKKEPLRPGDVIQYSNPIFVAGTAHALRVTQVIATDPTCDIPLQLQNGEILPPDCLVQRVREWRRGRLYRHCGISRCIEDFRFEKLSMTAAQLRDLPQMSNIVADILATADRALGRIPEQQNEQERSTSSSGGPSSDSETSCSKNVAGNDKARLLSRKPLRATRPLPMQNRMVHRPKMTLQFDESSSDDSDDSSIVHPDKGGRKVVMKRPDVRLGRGTSSDASSRHGHTRTNGNNIRRKHSRRGYKFEESLEVDSDDGSIHNRILNEKVRKQDNKRGGNRLLDGVDSDSSTNESAHIVRKRFGRKIDSSDEMNSQDRIRSIRRKARDPLHHLTAPTGTSARAGFGLSIGKHNSRTTRTMVKSPRSNSAKEGSHTRYKHESVVESFLCSTRHSGSQKKQYTAEQQVVKDPFRKRSLDSTFDLPPENDHLWSSSASEHESVASSNLPGLSSLAVRRDEQIYPNPLGKSRQNFPPKSRFAPVAEQRQPTSQTDLKGHTRRSSTLNPTKLEPTDDVDSSSSSSDDNGENCPENGNHLHTFFPSARQQNCSSSISSATFAASQSPQPKPPSLVAKLKAQRRDRIASSMVPIRVPTNCTTMQLAFVSIPRSGSGTDY